MSLLDIFEIENSNRIFSLDQVQYAFGSELSGMVVNKSTLIISMKCSLLKINLDFADSVQEISIPFSTDCRLFLDPTSCHLFLSSNAENYYLNLSSFKKIKSLTKFKGINITSIAWGRSSLNSTGTFLFAATNGCIYQGCVALDNGSLDVACTLVYTLGDHSIHGIFYQNLNAEKVMVLVCTSNRLVEFIVDDFTSKLFSPSVDNVTSMQELPGNINWSLLAISRSGSENRYPERWAWLTGKFKKDF